MNKKLAAKLNTKETNTQHAGQGRSSRKKDYVFIEYSTSFFSEIQSLAIYSIKKT
jgi:hypothetical protein